MTQQRERREEERIRNYIEDERKAKVRDYERFQSLQSNKQKLARNSREKEIIIQDQY